MTGHRRRFCARLLAFCEGNMSCAVIFGGRRFRLHMDVSNSDQLLFRGWAIMMPEMNSFCLFQVL
jgi:hypothetical protein